MKQSVKLKSIAIGAALISVSGCVSNSLRIVCVEDCTTPVKDAYQVCHSELKASTVTDQFWTIINDRSKVFTDCLQEKGYITAICGDKTLKDCLPVDFQ